MSVFYSNHGEDMFPEALSISIPCSDQFLKLKIYYGELNYEVIEEEYAYTVGMNCFQLNVKCNFAFALVLIYYPMTKMLRHFPHKLK